MSDPVKADVAAEFETFLKSLLPADLDALGVGVVLTGGLIAGADGKASMLELVAIGQSLLAGSKALGPAFSAVLMPAANQAMERVDAEIVASRKRLKQIDADQAAGKPLDAATQAWLDEVSEPLGLIGHYYDQASAVRARMPEAVRVAFDDHVAHLLLRVAEASGRILWWGEQINDDERAVARDIVARFGVEIRDPEIKAKFKLA